MATWREQKRVARAQVHAVMGLPCWRVPVGGATPVKATARIHILKVTRFNEGEGNEEHIGYGKREEVHPLLVFLKDEVRPVYGDVFLFAADEGYRVEADRPSDDITITAKCVRMDSASVTTAIARWSLDMTFA